MNESNYQKELNNLVITLYYFIVRDPILPV